jgi:hypothetical protein
MEEGAENGDLLLKTKSKTSGATIYGGCQFFNVVVYNR